MNKQRSLKTIFGIGLRIALPGAALGGLWIAATHHQSKKVAILPGYDSFLAKDMADAVQGIFNRKTSPIPYEDRQAHLFFTENGHIYVGLFKESLNKPASDIRDNFTLLFRMENPNKEILEMAGDIKDRKSNLQPAGTLYVVRLPYRRAVGRNQILTADLSGLGIELRTHKVSKAETQPANPSLGLE